MIEVLAPGVQTTLQDWPGRTGLWRVGVPPSGPMDDRSFRLGNVALGNPEGTPGLECTLVGPRLRFGEPATVIVCGADAEPTLDGEPVACWRPLSLTAGAELDIGRLGARGLRAYLLFAGGLAAPMYLGSAATFTLGGFGGLTGRALRKGDRLSVSPVTEPLPRQPRAVPEADRPQLTHSWILAVAEGPHGDAEFFTAADIEAFYGSAWEVHFNSARTGVRLSGPQPHWARPDGGEAGLHPSNIHDTPYSVGAADFTGDVPILLGPDGPSLGGFVCPATVLRRERWKLGQLRPGDTLRFERAGHVGGVGPNHRAPPEYVAHDGGVLHRREQSAGGPAVTYRRSGDDNLLVEYGPMELDLGLRMRVHALAERVDAERARGVLELTPGIRSLQMRLDPDMLSTTAALDLVRSLEDELPPTHDLRVSSRIVHLPLSWDDPATHEAIRRYMSGVRDDAPWCPWNIEFIRRINGLESVDEVRRIVFEACYLVLGLGDVYLGAPVATPLDPRHRLITTKYNPARTWTPENAVGIGGAYLCVYGIEGPGGYQFVGRTTQVWSNRSPSPFVGGKPWLLRYFDRIHWHPVSAEELLERRAELAAGRAQIEIEEGMFAIAEHREMLDHEAAGIAAFQATQTAAFAAEREAWEVSGEFASSVENDS